MRIGCTCLCAQGSQSSQVRMEKLDNNVTSFHLGGDAESDIGRGTLNTNIEQRVPNTGIVMELSSMVASIFFLL